MATSPTHKLIQIIQEGQAQMLDYLRRADERGERQSRATMKALGTISESLKSIQDGQKVLHEGQKAIAQMLLEMQAITAKTLELTRDIHSEAIGKKTTQH